VTPAEALPGFGVEPLTLRALRLFTVDVEEWYHSNFESAPDLDASRLPRRAEFGVARIIEALAEAHSRATFFVLGEVAEEQPSIVRRIADAGHEVACHSYSHTLLYQQSPEEVARDLSRARAVLQDLSGQPVTGFRAPSWSITRRNLWALDAVAEAGFAYDSSLFRGANYLYGLDGAPDRPCRLRTPAGADLVEVPPPTLSVGGRNIGVAGGVYLRLFPTWVHRRAMRRTLARGAPFLAYVHPREMDPASWPLELPLSAKEKLIHGFALARGAKRARALLAEGGWSAIEDLLERPE
jgi:polysaccharide deacetylase family protein (PEP-CTERM system associated)